MIRIWYQSSIEFGGAPQYGDALKRRFAQVADPDTQITLAGVPAGTWGGRQPSNLFGYPLAFQTLLAGPFIDNALRAEKEGYDAYLIGTYIEPFLREIRAAVDIPVVSSFEATLLTACSVGHTTALLTLNDSLLWILKTNLERHRLGARVGALKVVRPELTEREINTLLSSPEAYLERFVATAREAIEDGADVIVPAEGILAAIVAEAGITEIGGASVIDGIGAPVAYAEMMVKLWRRSGLRTGRGRHYARPGADIRDFLVQRRSGPARVDTEE